VISLIFLAILTMIGISALRNTALDQKVAINLKESHRSLEGAETGLVRGFADAAVPFCNVDVDTRGNPQKVSQPTLNAESDYTILFLGYAPVWETGVIGRVPVGDTTSQASSVEYDQVGLGAGPHHAHCQITSAAHTLQTGSRTTLLSGFYSRIVSD
jgi:hypothetical protein